MMHPIWSLLVKILMLNVLLFSLPVAYAIELEKALLYDRHTLPDNYPFRHQIRQFQWDKITSFLISLEKQQLTSPTWGTLRNYKNQYGQAQLVKNYQYNEYRHIVDKYGVERNQGIALYHEQDLTQPIRYINDGSLVKIIESQGAFSKIELAYGDDGRWLVANHYLKAIDNLSPFTHLVMIDRTNQNISVLEKQANRWLIRSMNPATTGRHHPPYGMETPVGIFVLQEKKRKMFYYRDGTTEIAGYAPYANRFSAGGYVHGVPLRGVTHQSEPEYSQSLGTVPLSHKCVRTATSHAKFIYDWAPIYQTLVIVYD